jgi:hypothetical protein
VEKRRAAGEKESAGKLPAEERVAWQTLWADMAALLKRTEIPAKKEGKR